jgi:hypothetical protein
MIRTAEMHIDNSEEIEKLAILLISESALGKDWLLPEEDAAWEKL